MSRTQPVFDWSQGRALVKEGIIYCSPNCNRPVVIPSPEQHLSPPFDPKKRLSASQFTQPVWWSDQLGWLGFIPLSPSFVSFPFEPLCWQPRVVETKAAFTLPSGEERSEKRWTTRYDDALLWMERERLMVEAADAIRIRYKIPGNPPPRPSAFGFTKLHKSEGVAKRMISVARDWFGVWMGFLSYLIAQSQTDIYKGKDRSEGPLPVWYTRLLDNGHPEAWLNGLSSSTVCSFTAQTLRAGIIMQWSATRDVARPSIPWFLEHHIPLWFPWTRKEEEMIGSDSSLQYLQPPNDLLQQALTFLLRIPSVPLAAIVMKRFMTREWDPLDEETVKVLRIQNASSFVFESCCRKFLGQVDKMPPMDTPDRRQAVIEDVKWVLAEHEEQHRREAEAAASLPVQTMLERPDGEQVKLFTHWEDLFASREARQQEIMKTERPADRQRRLARDAHPPMKRTTMYTWDKVTSSGGKSVWMRVRVDKKHQEDTFYSFKVDQRRYNAMANEWDLCDEFGTREARPSGTLSHGGFQLDSDDEDEGPASPMDTSRAPQASGSHTASVPLSPESPDFPPGSPDEPPINDSTAMDIDNPQEDEDSAFEEMAVDIVDHLSLLYGYVPALGATFGEAGRLGWSDVLNAIGLMTEPSIADPEKAAIRLFVSCLVGGSEGLPQALDDLHSNNHASLLHLFDFQLVQRPQGDLFVFHTPRSNACNWSLGVESPTVALYVCRYLMSNPAAHTILTIADRLLKRGMPFRTLLSLRAAPARPFENPFSPSSYRPAGYTFTVEDFECAFLQCKEFLSMPHGRAALLQGGIIGRIAREFLSPDCALDGPSVEVTIHRTGYFVASEHPGCQYWDDILTENEKAIICGTYKIYTGHGVQAVTESWFPPPSSWDDNGHDWIEWTEAAEQKFQMILQAIRSGKLQPKTHKKWRDYLRGFKSTRELVSNNKTRSEVYIMAAVPPPVVPPPVPARRR